jgi:ribosomal protein S27AE
MSSEKTATERLRELLDERGVRWTYADGIVNFSDGKYWCRAWAYNDDTMCVSMGYFTPEQAIAATLGRGTCRDLADTPKYGDKTRFECSECGYEYSAVGGFGCDYGDEPDFRFCPNCGRKVVDE